TPAQRGAGGPRCIRRADIPFEHRGSGQTERFVHHILDEHHPAEKLLLVEVVTPAGNWSSFPPHKHDQDIPGRETYLEETYYYRFDPPHGQALQRVYDKQGMDEVLTPHDGDVVLVPRGYHPVASPPGFTTYYLNVMAGHQRVWKYTVDRDYQHVTPKTGDITGEFIRNHR
ncbi:MAG: 5-deoxy-glucuronate isomerase, partial [Alicyclobacillus sp.]|nr:5-deoxy-glucuronate isomerase [Alicyclobacillus sp.]